MNMTTAMATNGFICVFPWARSTPKDGKNQPCPVQTILIKLPRDAAGDLAEPWLAGAADCPAGACLLVEYWVTGGVGVVEYLLVHGFLLVPGSTLVSLL